MRSRRWGETMSPLELRPDWEFVADTVMGGVSVGQVTSGIIYKRHAARLTGKVSLDNNGGFVQMAFDINNDGTDFDASAYVGIEIDVYGNDEVYDVRLRTSVLARPWQSYRASFTAKPKWSTIQLTLEQFVPHKTETPFDARCLRRIGILGIGRQFDADIAVSGIRLLNV